MKNINSFLDGKSAKEMKKVAEDLRSGKIDLDFEWRSDEDRKLFADIIEKVAELKEICPAIQGCFALECDIDDESYTRHSPSLVVSDDTIASDATTKDEEEANAYATRCELVAKQAGLLADEARKSVEATLGDIASACFKSRGHGGRMEVRLHTLESVLPIIGPLVDIKSEGDAAEEALREIIGKKENKDDGECGGSCCRKCSKNKNC